ncbi:CGNR zinc finger domain-containing protein [Streptomyces griseus]|uniref:CGNR zinc finger domain-containing protein n=1 Tax=Streptomyces griseus TaxID=1911 RepID=UPI00099B54CA|nr:CGNR zinc finger domain-containing protein [Streptomyces griseus]
MRYIAPVPSPAYDWSSRHSVLTMARRTAALLNVLSTEDGPDPTAIAEVLLAYGETGPVDLAARDVDGMRTAAALLRQVFTADGVDGAAEVLNRLLRDHTGPLRLTAHGGRTPWHPHLDLDDDAPWDEWLIASSCMALTVLLWDRQLPPGRVCASPSCPNVFITQGAGPERRYCSRRCATRERVAAHRRASRSSPAHR